MHSHRDYFLKHMGIGEIWQLRQPDSSTVLVPNHSANEGVLASVSELRQGGDDILALVKDIAQCAACSLCGVYGKCEELSMRAECDLVLLVDWSDHENLAPDLAMQFERLAQNIAAAATELGMQVQLLPLLQSVMPTEQVSLPVADSLAACGSFLQRYLLLQRPRYVLSFGARCTSATGVPTFSNGVVGELDWNGISVLSLPSLYEVLVQVGLKRVVWQQLCRLASR